jgi:hypothetical protein
MPLDITAATMITARSVGPYDNIHLAGKNAQPVKK